MKNKLLKLLLLQILFFILCIQTQAKRARKERTLTLDNGLAVRLIHDEKVHRSAAALSVGIGSLAQPVDVLGLPHFLEHMLFMGTKKFPRVDEYQEYLTKNSGYSNAYTSMDETNYYFEVSHAAFPGALDRFSRFFIDPLFNPEYVDKERDAVNSEHEKNITNDVWRFEHLILHIGSKAHPVHLFSTGNKETLSGNNLPVLIDFFKKYYSAKNMKICILSKHPLDEQERLVRQLFSEVPGFEPSPLQLTTDYRPPLKTGYRFLTLEPVKELRLLSLSFPTIQLYKYKDSKPGKILGSILGHEGRGSLLSLLKKEGLALSLAAGAYDEAESVNSFFVQIQLTEKGLKNIQRILQCFFAYLKMLKKQGITRYTYLEQKKMAKIKFDWKDPEEGGDFVSGITSFMHDYALSEIATGPYLIQKYDPSAYKKLLDTLYVENMLLILQAREKEIFKVNGRDPEKAHLAGYRTEKFYNAKYKLTQPNGPSYRKLKNPPLIKELHYPEPNRFIPEDLSLLEEKPILLQSGAGGRLWFLKDTRFKQPRLFFKILINSIRVYETPEDAVLASLYSYAINEALNEELYPIKEAGLNVTLSNNKRGITLMVSGFRDRIFLLFEMLANSIKRIEIDHRKFKQIKEFLLKSMMNKKFEEPSDRVGYFSEILLYQKHFEEIEEIKALQKVSFEDLLEYVRTLYDSTYLQAIAYGDARAEQVKKAFNYLLLNLNSTPLPEDFRFANRITQLANAEKAIFSVELPGNNALLKKEFQMGKANSARRALQRLVFQIIDNSFYKQLRTEQQLGYTVYSYEIDMAKTLFGILLVQSGKYPADELKRRVDSWVKEQEQFFQNLKNAAFTRYKDSVITQLSKKPDSIEEMGERLFWLMINKNENFDYFQQELDAVKNTSLKETICYAREMFNNPKTPVLDILLRAKGQKTIKGFKSAKIFKKGREFR
ncbi:insulinase family protein [Candidatus Riflebacteria bacterium]